MNVNPDLLVRAERNYVSSWQTFASLAENGRVETSNELAVAISTAPEFWMNTIFAIGKLSSPQESVEQAIKTIQSSVPSGVLSFFEGRDPRGEEVARSCNLNLHSVLPMMLLEDLSSIPDRIDALTIREVCNEEDLQNFSKVCNSAFDISDECQKLAEDSQRAGHAKLFVGLVGATAVACSMLMMVDGVAGVYWVGTLQDYRGKGFGTALTWEAVRAGMEQKADFATLQATPEGKTVYEKMGFVTAANFNNYRIEPC